MDRAAFDQLYAGSPDPYGLRDRWYEVRKRAIVLAALPRQRYGSAYEPACGVGELTRELAQRCDRLLASDYSARAVAVARERTRAKPNVEVVQHAVPADWPRPEAGFDLIVLSELGYFLGEDEMTQVARCCERTLAPQGTLLACHWTPPFDERRLPTSVVHALLDGLGLAKVAHYEDEDFLLDVWERAGISVAQREGIRETSTP